MTAAVLALSIVLFTMLTVTLINAFTWPRLVAVPPSHPTTRALPPSLSVLVPVRDEAAVIDGTVRRLLSQTHHSFEVLLLDDGSSDGTADIASQAAGDDPRFRLITGQPLPDGWLGKNWACQQLADQASGSTFVFTDADVLWSPTALAALDDLASHRRADLFTVWPRQHTESFTERAVVPLMAFVVLAWLPLPLVRWPRAWACAAANGQCLWIRRAEYQRIGGHAAVRGDIVEDVGLARRVKAAGGRLDMAHGASFIACRMYRNWSEVRDGYAKNVLAGHGHVLALIASTAFHLVLLVLPWLWLASGIHLGSARWPWAPLTLVALAVAVRGATAGLSGQRMRDAWNLPLGALLMTAIAVRSVRWQWTGGPRWKGRTAALPTAPRHSR